MANSKYQYVKAFEQPDHLLPSSYIVVRLDGRGFHRLAKEYDFKRPNDIRALNVMNAAAEAVMLDLSDIALAYGVSDEYSFVFERDTTLFERRESKLVSTVVSTFSVHYVLAWARLLPDTPLSSPLPTFDGRAVVYPRFEILRDYLNWRQVDCHINNLYNTTFWTLVQQGGMSNAAAEQRLKGTLAKDKNEILFSNFGLNYNDEKEIFKKGSILSRKPDADVGAEGEPLGQTVKGDRKKRGKTRLKHQIMLEHVDLIKDAFWEERRWLFAD